MGNTEWEEAVDGRLREAFERADEAWRAIADGRDEYGNPLTSGPEATTARRERDVAADAWNTYRAKHGRPPAVES